MKDAVDILLDLVAIPSVSPMNNQPVIDYVTSRLRPSDWNIHLHPYLDPDGTPVAIGVPRPPRREVAAEAKPPEREPREAVGFARAPMPDMPLEYSIVRIFYATDRQKAANGRGYTGSRDRDERLSVVTCDGSRCCGSKPPTAMRSSKLSLTA